MECAVCEVKASRKCTGCWTVVYCSEDHQAEHWLVHKQVCSRPMELKSDPVFGQHWVAARDLSAGTLLVTEVPVLKVPSWPFGIHDFYEWNDDASCLGCGFHIQEPCFSYLCSKCGWPVCDVDCEKASLHADNECQVFLEKKFKFPPPCAALISPKRVDWAVLAIRASRLKQSNPRSYRELLNLQHKPSITMTELISDNALRLAVSVLHLHLEIENMGMSSEEIVKLFWIVKLNAVSCTEMVDNEEEVVRARTDCVYAKLSKFNNSCAPNCSRSMKPKAPDYQMTVRTAIEVKKGEPLTIPYIDNLCAPFYKRQACFRERFFFVCKCKRCVDPTELGTYHSAIACSSCLVDRKKGMQMDVNAGYLLPEDPIKSLEDDVCAIWKCNRCHKETAASTFLPSVKKLARLVQKPLKNLEMVEKLKNQYSGKLLHPDHWILHDASQSMLQLWNQLQEEGKERFPFEDFKTHLLYRLAIENILSPGISHDRAHLQRDFVIAVVTTHQLEKDNKTYEEKVEMLKTCHEFIRESNQFFGYFKEGVPQGAINFLVTSNLKKTIESFMIDMGISAEENK